MSKNSTRTDPVFLLSPGRSGSTLLQRYLNCSPDLTLWGEHGGFLKNIRQAYSVVCENKRVQYLLNQGKDHADLLVSSKEAIGVDIEWTNNFSPERFRENITCLITDFFTNGVPAHVRWGFKEIRYDDKDVFFLKDLFPDSQFIFIVRDPFDTLASSIVALAKGKELWETGQSDEDIKQIKEQAAFWAERTSAIASGISVCLSRNEGYLVRYEELKANPVKVVNNLCRYLGITVPAEEQIRLIAGDVRHGMDTARVRERLSREFIGEPGVQNVLEVYKPLGYNRSVLRKLFK